MTTSARRLALAALLTAAAAIGGCTSYYQVTDPGTQRTYYSTDVDTDKIKSGAVRFTDAKSGAEVTLQSSEVKKITKDEYEAAVGKKK